MSLKEEADLLRNIPIFSKIEPAKLKLLAFTSERLAFEPGQALFHQGDAGDAAYIIVEGNADVEIATPNGPVKVAEVTRNAVIGEIAILCDVPRTATVTAKTRLTTLRIGKENFFRLVNEFPQMSIEIMRALAQRLEKTNEQLRAAMSRPGVN